MAELYPNQNKQIIFAKRPVNKLGLDSFRTDVVEPFDWKSVELKKGDILVRNLLISIDPSMRFHMEHHPGGFTYIPILETEEPVHARAISVVLRSEREDIKEGEIRWVGGGWEDYSVLPADGMTWPLPLDGNEDFPLSYHLGLLGMTGMTAYAGLFEIGRPKEGQTVLVNAASGAVGQAAVQFAKLCGLNLRVIASAGSDEKCEFLKKIGADVVFNYKTLPTDKTEAERKIREIAGEKGVDIFFDNVGGEFLDMVIPSLNQNGVVVQSGWVSGYDRQGSAGAGNTFRNLPNTIVMRLRIEGFVVFDYMFGHPMQQRFWNDVPKWLREGKFTYKEDIREGLENAPQALLDVLAGRNAGKTVVRVIKDKEFGKYKVY